MAKIMQYTDTSGVTHDSSYWIPVRVTIDRIQNIANVDFYGYSSQANRIAGKSPIGSKFYIVEGDIFEQFFGVATQDGLGINPINKAYEVAEQTLEEDGFSFFNTAVNG